MKQQLYFVSSKRFLAETEIVFLNDKILQHPVSVAVGAALHTLSNLKLMLLCIGVAECATEHFPPFFFIHFTCDGPGIAPCSLQTRGVHRVRSSEAAGTWGERGGCVPAGRQEGPADLTGKIAINALSVEALSGHLPCLSPYLQDIKIGEFGRTVHRSI